MSGDMVVKVSPEDITYAQAAEACRGLLRCSVPIVPASTYKRVLKPQEKVIRMVWDDRVYGRNVITVSGKEAEVDCKYDDLVDKPVLMRGAHLRMVESYKYRYNIRDFCTELLRRYMRINAISAFGDWEKLSDIWDKFRGKYKGRELDKRAEYPALHKLHFRDSLKKRSGRNYRVRGLGKYCHKGEAVNFDKISLGIQHEKRIKAALGRLNNLAMEYMEMEKEFGNPLSKLDVIIESPADLRRQLLDSISGVLSGQITVAQANAAVGLSAELHKSIKQQWEMQVYATEHLELYAPKKITAD